MKTNEEMFKELDDFIDSLNSDPKELIAILHRAQDIFGYLPMVVQTHIARKLNINVSKVYGVVSFYSFFSMKPKGENVIAICLGTACFVRGSGKILERVEELLGIKNGETTPDGKFTITTLRCVGACGLAPVMQINDKTYGNITPEDVESILANY
ncbi:MAG: NAD(P)H-dependent oxidoreductase subunit E [Bacillales bacterium]|nr:NAD(P)H-dependent oxidoreductase subunit E [Bacillales bacterium]